MKVIFIVIFFILYVGLYLLHVPSSVAQDKELIVQTGCNV